MVSGLRMNFPNVTPLWVFGTLDVHHMYLKTKRSWQAINAFGLAECLQSLLVTGVASAGGLHPKRPDPAVALFAKGLGSHVEKNSNRLLT